MVNYITEINTFWDNAPYLPGFKSDYGFLYLAIADSVNRNFWKDTEIEYDRIINKTRLGKRMYLEAREWLQANNFITFTKGRNDYARACFNIVVQKCTATDTATSTTTDTSTAPQLHRNCTTAVPYIDKTINNKTIEQVNNKQTDVDADRVGFENVVEEPSSEEKKETPSKVAQKVSPSVHARIREVIQTENKGYYWQGKDGTATKSIIKKITFRWGEKNGGEPTEDQIVESFVWLVKNLPEWYKNKWDACLIESKFESIVKEIHEQRNGNKQNGNSYGQPGANGISPRFAEAWELLDKSRKAVPT